MIINTAVYTPPKFIIIFDAYNSFIDPVMFFEYCRYCTRFQWTKQTKTLALVKVVF